VLLTYYFIDRLGPHTFGQPATTGRWGNGGSGGKSGGGWTNTPIGGGSVIGGGNSYTGGTGVGIPNLSNPENFLAHVKSKADIINSTLARAVRYAYNPSNPGAWDPSVFNEIFGGEENAAYAGPQDTKADGLKGDFAGMAYYLSQIDVDAFQRAEAETLYIAARGRLIAALRDQTALIRADSSTVAARLAAWTDHPVLSAAEWNRFLTDQALSRKFAGWADIYDKVADAVSTRSTVRCATRFVSTRSSRSCSSRARNGSTATRVWRHSAASSRLPRISRTNCISNSACSGRSG
jgi:hypothetical protein